MFALDDIYKHQPRQSYIQTNDAIDLCNFYSNPPDNLIGNHTYSNSVWVDWNAAHNAPMELKKFCQSTEHKLVIHFA